jgi:type II secretory pathway component GspD/PulD (secretin)
MKSLLFLCILILLLHFFLKDFSLIAQERDSLSSDKNYITLHATCQDLHEIVAFIRDQTGKHIVVDPDLSIGVTISIENLFWLEALHQVATEANCKVTPVSDIIWKVDQPRPLLEPLEEEEEEEEVPEPLSFKDISCEIPSILKELATSLWHLKIPKKTKAFSLSFIQKNKDKREFVKLLEKMLSSEGELRYDKTKDTVFITDKAIVLHCIETEILFLQRSAEDQAISPVISLEAQETD